MSSGRLPAPGARARRAGGRARAARRRHHEPQLPRARRRARVRAAPAGQGHGRCWGSTGRPSARRHAAAAARASGRRWSRSGRRARLPRHGFVTGEPLEPEELREPALLARGRGRGCARSTPARRCPRRFDSFAIVETYRATAADPAGRRIPDALRRRARRWRRRRIRAALSGPEHAPVPCHNDLLPANFICTTARVCGSSTGSTREWATATSTSANLSVNNGFAEDDDERLLAAYWGEPATPQRFAALRLMRVMSDFREAHVGRRADRASPSWTSTSPATPPSTSTRVRRGAADPRFEALARGGPWRSGVTCPAAARCVIIGGGVGGTRRSPTTWRSSAGATSCCSTATS